MRVSAVTGSQKVASLLIEAGADVNVRDKDGKTPLMVHRSPRVSGFGTTTCVLGVEQLVSEPWVCLYSIPEPLISGEGGYSLYVFEAPAGGEHG